MFSLLFSTFTKCPAKIKENVHRTKGPRLAKPFDLSVLLKGLLLATPPSFAGDNIGPRTLVYLYPFFQDPFWNGRNIVCFNAVNRPY